MVHAARIFMLIIQITELREALQCIESLPQKVKEMAVSGQSICYNRLDYLST
jgi:hypothetical protein